MYLIPESVLPYLMGRNLLSPEELVDGDVVVLDSRRRNRNFTIRRPKDVDLFVKQVQMSVPETVNGMFREAACYQLADEHPAFAALKPYTPRFYDYDPHRMVMVIEKIEAGENLSEHHQRMQDYPERTGELTGLALAAIHGAVAGTDISQDPQLRMLFPQEIPWILHLGHRPDQVMPGRSQGVTQMVTHLQQMPDVLQGLAQIIQGWTRSTLIHGDIKWDNFLMVSDQDRQSLRIIDWELADYGDPAWDLAYAFNSYLLNAHFASMMRSANPAMQQQPGRLHELQATWPATRALWRAYVREMGLSGEQARLLLTRSIYFVGGRLIVNCVEMLQSAQTMSPEAQSLLHLARSIFARPAEVAAHWLGLDQADVFQQTMQGAS